jgi:small subunit ribosomal protein S2
MSQVTMKQLLEAGVHFGHQTSRWNPKMRPFIFGARNGIHIIDLQQTVTLFREACDFVREVASKGGTVLFVGTKKQAQEAIKSEAERCKQYHVNNRWLGGTLTNFQTIKQSVDRMRRVEETLGDPAASSLYKKKERLLMQRELDKLNFNLAGIRDMKRAPDAIFVIDPDREQIAVAEANRLKIPVVAVVDTNCDPDRIAYCVPGNDDAIRAIRLFCGAIADSVLEGAAEFDARGAVAEKGDGTSVAFGAGSFADVVGAGAEQTFGATAPTFEAESFAAADFVEPGTAE